LRRRFRKEDNRSNSKHFKHVASTHKSEDSKAKRAGKEPWKAGFQTNQAY